VITNRVLFSPFISHGCEIPRIDRDKGWDGNRDTEREVKMAVDKKENAAGRTSETSLPVFLFSPSSVFAFLFAWR